MDGSPVWRTNGGSGTSIQWIGAAGSAAPNMWFGDCENVEETKYHSPVAPPPALDVELPEWSGRPRVTLMAVNPYLIYVYWDFNLASLPSDTAAAALRFYDAASYFDVDVDLRTGNWYVPLWNPAKTYYADLGAITASGEFVPLIRSNTIRTSRAWPAAEVQEGFDPGAAASPHSEEAVPPQTFPFGFVDSYPTAVKTPAAQAEPVVVSLAPGQPPAPITDAPPDQHIPQSPIPTPLGAAESLRRRLSDIREFRHGLTQTNSPGVDATQPGPPFRAAPDLPGWQWEPPPAQGNPMESFLAVAAFPRTPDAPDDLTGRAEREFSPGVSSLLPGAQRRKLAD